MLQGFEASGLQLLTQYRCISAGLELLVVAAVAIVHVKVVVGALVQATVVIFASNGSCVFVEIPLLVRAIVAFVHVDVARAYVGVHALVVPH